MRIISIVVPSSQWLALEGCAAQFSDLLTLQLDFVMEARNLMRAFLSNLRVRETVKGNSLVRPS